MNRLMKVGDVFFCKEKNLRGQITRIKQGVVKVQFYDWTIALVPKKSCRYNEELGCWSDL